MKKIYAFALVLISLAVIWLESPSHLRPFFEKCLTCGDPWIVIPTLGSLLAIVFLAHAVFTKLFRFLRDVWGLPDETDLETVNGVANTGPANTPPKNYPLDYNI